MHLIILFFFTFLASFGASVLPGLLNMNAAKISAEKGKKYAIAFSIGVCIIIACHALLAVYISKFLFNNKHILDMLMVIAIAIFGLFAVYFFFRAFKGKEKEKKVKLISVNKRNSLFKGMLLGALNLLTLPFYCGLNAFFKVNGWIKFEFSDTFIFVIAAASGTFCILYVYIFYFNKLETKTNVFSKNSYYIMGALMLVLVVITLIKFMYR